MGKDKEGLYSYHLQHLILTFIVPAIYFPVLVIYQNIIFIYERKNIQVNKIENELNQNL